MSDGEQVCFIYRLKPGCGPEYDRRHAEVPSEIRDRIRARGIRDYSIFRRGDLVISVLRRGPTDDGVNVASTEEIQREWSASLAPLFECITDPQGEDLIAECVFRLD